MMPTQTLQIVSSFLAEVTSRTQLGKPHQRSNCPGGRRRMCVLCDHSESKMEGQVVLVWETSSVEQDLERIAECVTKIDHVIQLGTINHVTYSQGQPISCSATIITLYSTNVLFVLSMGRSQQITSDRNASAITDNYPTTCQRIFIIIRRY